MTGSASAQLAEMFALVDRDADRDHRSLWLTANEGLMSATATSYMNAAISHRYFSGAGDSEAVVTNSYTPFMSRGRPGIASLVDAASTAAASMMDAHSINLNCLSGIHAMTCVILALSQPGDAVMSLEVTAGGHFATRHIVERSGRRWLPAPVIQSTWQLDPEALAADCGRLGITLLYLDSSYELQPHDVGAVRQAVGEDVIVVYDVSHTMGLIMGGALPSPLALGADAICGNTHKTLPGPHRALIGYRDDRVAAAANAVIEGGLYSSNHLVTLIGLAVTVIEMANWGHSYARRIVDNARALAAALAEWGWDVRTSANGEFTSTHQVHVRSQRLGDHRALYGHFSASNIALGFDNCLGGRTFIRLGTQEITRRGMTEADMRDVAELLVLAASGIDVKTRVAEVAKRHDTVHYSFDCHSEQRCGRCS